VPGAGGSANRHLLTTRSHLSERATATGDALAR